jgi:cell division protein FtsQ
MKTSIYKIFRMVQFINKNNFWKAMIEEIFINKKGEIELFTKIGEQTVIFGDIDNMKEKFDNLFIFYKQGLNKVGWTKYKTLNLKYKNQIVCSKI